MQSSSLLRIPECSSLSALICYFAIPRSRLTQGCLPSLAMACRLVTYPFSGRLYRIDVRTVPILSIPVRLLIPHHRSNPSDLYQWISDGSPRLGRWFNRNLRLATSFASSDLCCGDLGMS